MAELIPIPFENLLKRLYHEYARNEAIFDLPARKFYQPRPELDLRVSFCGNIAANPAGPAAGPQTQLAQNIVLAWLAGGRVIELKTVQINDRLQLTRPCIDMATVGYNSEWSQELRLDESLREYVKASMMVEILKNSFHVSGFKFQVDKKLPETSDMNLETIFDISVGYDLAGIQSPQIRSWLRSMSNASEMIEEYRKQIPDEFAAYRDLPFKKEIGNSITLSTFHGTPAREIERICEFLLEEMDYHVIIKMNPPMLGKERLEHLLYEKLEYRDIEISQRAFDVNITFPDAVDVVRRLQTIAARRRKTIGVKFGNTLEVINKGTFLKEKFQYLSGQPLHILHLALVEEWRKAFGAGFPVSFAGGVDAQNFADCVGIGLVPVTTCTDLLRQGGYGRMQQYLVNLEKKMRDLGASTVHEFIIRSARRDLPPEHARSAAIDESILQNTTELLRRSIEDSRYHADHNRRPPRKIGRHLHLWDCINCDKCIPVCPNDANFSFDVKPIETQYNNIEIDRTRWHETDGGQFVVRESHQIATLADACNDCGNCDVFCPEDGGPYIEKPRFFSSVDSWKHWKKLNGFVLCREDGANILYGRFGQVEYRLAVDKIRGRAKFSNNEAVVELDWISDKVLDAAADASSRIVVNMSHYLTMATLLRGIINSSHVNFVNVGFL